MSCNFPCWIDFFTTKPALSGEDARHPPVPRPTHIQIDDTADLLPCARLQTSPMNAAGNERLNQRSQIQTNPLKRTMNTLIRSALFLMLICGIAQATEGYKCTSNSECADWEYCKTTKICPGNDVTGRCTARPQTCTMDDDPVTGCDGTEYSNACMAAANGQSVKVKRKGMSHHNKKRYERNHQNTID